MRRNNNDKNESLEDSKVNKDLMDLISKSWGNYCSSCGEKKDPSKLKVFRKIGPATQILSECEKCGLKTILTIIPNLGMQISQIRSDISPQEFERFQGPITSNDYLDFYNESRNVSTTNDLIKLINNVK